MADLRDRLAETHPDVTVWAGGGLIIRDADGELEVLLVHRPAHDDWSFPKGKLDDGETLGRCAQREVHEETGYRCRRLRRLPEVRYRDGRGREKLVVYWTMEIVEGEFAPNDEVDVVGWFGLTAAANVLSYGHDIELLDAIRPVERHLKMLA